MPVRRRRSGARGVTSTSQGPVSGFSTVPVGDGLQGIAARNYLSLPELAAIVGLRAADAAHTYEELKSLWSASMQLGSSAYASECE